MADQFILIFILFIPLLVFLSLFQFGKIKSYAGYIATSGFLVGFGLSVYQLFNADAHINFTWFHVGDIALDIHLRSDVIAKSMTTLVYFIASLVCIYSIKYMNGENHYHKYFGYLGMFTFSMLGIVLFNNLLFVYAFWELVGLSSYLLIGFWYQNPLATMASKKAFIINRVGDIGFLAGILLLWARYKNLDISILTEIISSQNAADTVIALCLFCGCIGKSAQFPLQVWLPDAMQGPTPASALIHAATMVAAGIYLMMRIVTLCTVDALVIIGFIGALTAFMSAITACFQNDIKKILAYSTISQLGYMVVGISTGKEEVAYLHLFTHAFFKAGLFLCAGAIIHEIAHHKIVKNGKTIDPQDIRNMGGLRSHMKFTYWAYLLCYISAVGIPFSSGFVSKDFIIGSLLDVSMIRSNFLQYVSTSLIIITVALTAYYMTRQLILVFWGEFRAHSQVHFHETPPIMLIPIFMLGVFSIFIFTASNPFDAHSSYLLHYLQVDHFTITNHTSAMFISISFTFIGIGLAYIMHRKGLKQDEEGSFFPLIAYNHFYVNKFYMRILIPMSLVFAKKLNKLDTKILDKSIDRFGIANVILAHTLKVTDQYLVDGFYALLAGIGSWIGGVGASLQSRKIQNYVLTTIILFGILIALILSL